MYTYYLPLPQTLAGEVWNLVSGYTRGSWENCISPKQVFSPENHLAAYFYQTHVIENTND